MSTFHSHCKAMAADWEKLAEEITDPNVMIAEVDCTAEDSEQVCDENGVEGFPTLKFGDSSFLDDVSISMFLYGFVPSGYSFDLMKFYNSMKEEETLTACLHLQKLV